MMAKNPFLLPPEFYKNLFAASAILQKPNQLQNDCNKLFNAQNFPRNLLFSCGDDKEVNSRHLLSFFLSSRLAVFLRRPPFIEINVCNFLVLLQHKAPSSGFSWPTDQPTSEHPNKSNNNSEKDKIKKLDFEPETSPKTPLTQQDSNFSVSPASATNLETMPVPGAQGQNPTQGQNCCESLYDSRLFIPLVLRSQGSFIGWALWWPST